MIGKIIRVLAKYALGKNLLELSNRANKMLTGVRSELCIGLYALLFLLKKFGLVGAEADPLLAGLLGALPVTILEKVRNASQIAEEVIPKPTEPPPAA